MLRRLLVWLLVWFYLDLIIGLSLLFNAENLTIQDLVDQLGPSCLSLFIRLSCCLVENKLGQVITTSICLVSRQPRRVTVHKLVPFVREAFLVNVEQRLLVNLLNDQGDGADAPDIV